VKKKGGVKRVAPGEKYVVPQWQKSKGWMILTAALELSRNRVTHFYSRAKNTEEMIRMADLLRGQYRYLPYDLPILGRSLVAYLEEAAHSFKNHSIRNRTRRVSHR